MYGEHADFNYARLTKQFQIQDGPRHTRLYVHLEPL